MSDDTATDVYHESLLDLTRLAIHWAYGVYLFMFLVGQLAGRSWVIDLFGPSFGGLITIVVIGTMIAGPIFAYSRYAAIMNTRRKRVTQIFDTIPTTTSNRSVRQDVREAIQSRISVSPAIVQSLVDIIAPPFEQYIRAIPQSKPMTSADIYDLVNRRAPKPTFNNFLFVDNLGAKILQNKTQKVVNDARHLRQSFQTDEDASQVPYRIIPIAVDEVIRHFPEFIHPRNDGALALPAYEPLPLPSLRYEVGARAYQQLSPRAHEVWEQIASLPSFSDWQMMEAPTTIDPSLRFEHSWCVAPSGGGKTSLLSYLIARDLDRVAHGTASVIVMETTRDLAVPLSRNARFAPGGDLDGKLIYIDFDDVNYPLAINVFDLVKPPDTASDRDKEELYNAAMYMLEYIFTALLKMELTGHQGRLFRFTVELMMSIPGATLDTMMDVMDKGGLAPYRDRIPHLSPAAQRFFTNDFETEQQLQKTKSEVKARISSLTSIRALAGMFSSKETRFDFYDQLASSKVIVINLPTSLLQAETTEIVGRFLIALIFMASQKRTLLPQEQRLDTFMYLDEAHDIIGKDTQMPRFLAQARRSRVALTVSHQNMDTTQMSTEVIAALNGGTAIKFIGPVSHANALIVSRNMGMTEPGFIQMQPRHHFAVHARGMPTAISAQFSPPMDFQKVLHMKDEQAQVIQDDMRKRFSVAPPPRTEGSVIPMPPPSQPKKKKLSDEDLNY